MKVLIDTNVCLDVVLNRVPFATDALEIVDRSQNNKFVGMLAAHTFDTLFYIIKNKVGKAKAYKGIKELRKVFEVAPITQQIIDEAIADQWNDFEDAIHYQSALSVGCEAIVTRNEKDFSSSEIPVFSPRNFLDRLN